MYYSCTGPGTNSSYRKPTLPECSRLFEVCDWSYLMECVLKTTLCAHNHYGWRRREIQGRLIWRAQIKAAEETQTKWHGVSSPHASVGPDSSCSDCHFTQTCCALGGFETRVIAPELFRYIYTITCFSVTWMYCPSHNSSFYVQNIYFYAFSKWRTGSCG